MSAALTGLASDAVAGHTVAVGLNPDSLLGSYGLAGLMIILFAECGLLIGFFLPGDTLLLAAGIGLSIGTIKGSLPLFLILAPLAAIAGNLVGYWIGYRAGPHVFHRPDSKFFDPAWVERSERFFDKYGSWTVILARFVPIVRTVATVMAGVGRMRFSLYALYSVIGGILWADGVILLGHALGKVKFVRDHKSWIDYAIIVVVVLSLLPTAVHYWHARRRTSPANRTEGATEPTGS